MSDSQSLVFQEVDEPQTAHAVQQLAAPVAVRPSSRPPLQPGNTPKGVAVQPLVLIKPKKKIITTLKTTPSVNSEDSIQFISVPSRSGTIPTNAKPAEVSSPTPRLTTPPQRPRVAPRSAADSTHSANSSIQFHVDDAKVLTSPPVKGQHSDSDRDSQHHYYSSHATASSRPPPLVHATNRPVHKPSAHSEDVEESIAFQDTGDSLHSLAHGHGLPEIPNDSIAFQVADDDSGGGHAGVSQSFPHMFKPLCVTPTNRASPDASLAFEIEDHGASCSRGRSPRVSVPAVRSPSPQSLNDDSIAFQLEDSVPRCVEHHAERPPVRRDSVADRAHNRTSATASPAAALSPDSDRGENQSFAFRFEDNSSVDSLERRSPMEVVSPHQGDARSNSGGGGDNESDVKPKKTVVSNRLQKLSRSSSPAQRQRGPQSPPPSTVSPRSPPPTSSGGEDGAVASGRKSSRSKKKASVPTSSAPQPEADVDMPKKRRQRSKSTEKPRSSRSDSKHKHKHRHRRSHQADEDPDPENKHMPRTATETPSESKPPPHPPVNTRGQRDGSHRSSSSGRSGTAKTESDECVCGPPLLRMSTEAPLAPSEASAVHSRDNSSTIVVNHLREQESHNAFHQDALHQQQQRQSTVGSERHVSRSLLQEDGYGQRFVHSRDETAVYPSGGGGGGVSGWPASATAQHSTSYADALTHAPDDVMKARQEAAYWSAFNASQRQELMRLQQRIRAAKRQDRTLLERTVDAVETPRAGTAESPRAGGYAAAAGSQTTFRWKQSPPLGHSSTTVDAPGSGKSPRVLLSSPIPQRGLTAARRQKAPVRGASEPCAEAPSPQKKNTKTAAVEKNPQTEVGAAQEAVARMLGLLWPPQRPNELYFLTGTRLTPLQVQRFYETVEVQRATANSTATPNAAAGVTGQQTESTQRRAQSYMSPTQLRRSASQDGCVSSRGASETSCSPLSIRATNRKSIKRSQVLRDVFDAMDIAKRGLLHSKDLASLHYLLEHELTNLEARMGGESNVGGPTAGSDSVERTARAPPPLHGLVTTAARQRELYETAWRGLSRDVAVLDAASAAASETSFAFTRAEREQHAALQRQALRLSLAVNVVIPLCRTSGIGAFDFSTMSLLVFTALDRADTQSTPQGKAWRDMVAQYFAMLS